MKVLEFFCGFKAAVFFRLSARFCLLVSPSMIFLMIRLQFVLHVYFRVLGVLICFPHTTQKSGLGLPPWFHSIS